jgi:hypothetical protein
MTDNTARFADLIGNWPCLAPYWNSEFDEFDVPALKKRLRTMSTGEAHIARFAMCVWTWKDHKFNLSDAASSLDRSSREVIANWFLDPFWP